MSDIIKGYYIRNNTLEYRLNQKMESFRRNLDIAKEFEHWISLGEFVEVGTVEIEGYTTKKLSELSQG